MAEEVKKTVDEKAAEPAKDTKFKYVVTKYSDGSYNLTGLPLKDGGELSISFQDAVNDVISLGKGLEQDIIARQIATTAAELATKQILGNLNAAAEKVASSAKIQK